MAAWFILLAYYSEKLAEKNAFRMTSFVERTFKVRTLKVEDCRKNLVCKTMEKS